MSQDPLVQFVLTNNDRQSGADLHYDLGPTESKRHHYLQHPSLAGNFLWICFRVADFGSNNPSVACKDDTGTSWTQAPGSPFEELGNGTKFCFFYRANCPAGIQHIELDFGGSLGVGYGQAAYGEFAHVDATTPIDTSIGFGKSSGGTTSWASGSITTTNTCIILHVGTSQSTPAWTGLVGMQSGYTGLGVDLYAGMGAEYNWDVAAGAVNPSMSLPASDGTGFLSITVPLRMNTSQGTLPDFSKPRVLRCQWMDVDGATYPTAMDGQFCCTGNLLVSGSQVGATAHVTDTTNGTWTQTAGVSTASAGYVRFDYVESPSVSATGLHIQLTNLDGGKDSTVLYDVMCTVPLAPDSVGTGGVVTDSGHQTIIGPLTPTNTITPSAPNGIVFFNLATDASTIHDTTDNSTYLVSQPWAPEYNGGENQVAEDDGWAIALPTGTPTALAPTWNYNTKEALGDWSYAAMSFVPSAPASATVSGTATPSMTPSDVVAGGKTIIVTLSGTTFVPASGSALATLQYVGKATGTGNSTSFNISLTSLTGGIDTAARTNDLVIVATGFVSTANGDPGVSTAGYVETSDLYGNDTRDTNFSVSYKFMGATPDTTVACNGSGSTTNGAAGVAYVWRNVDLTTPLDVAVVNGTPVINSSTIDSPAITPVTAGAMVLTLGGATGASVNNSPVAPSGYTNAASATVDPGSSYTVVVASKVWGGSGAEDPGAWTGITTTTSESGAAVTLALRPATIATTPFNDARQAFINGVVSAQSEATGWNARVTPAIPVANVVRTSDTVVTLTLPAVASYSITAPETITVTAPASIVASGSAITGTPTFQVAAAGTAYVRFGPDAAHTSEGRLRLGVFRRSASNTVDASEGRLRLVTALRVRGDAAHESEGGRRLVVALRTGSNSLHATDASARPLAALRASANTAQASELSSKTGQWVRTSAATATVSEGVKRVGAWLRKAAATLSGAENVRRVTTLVRTLGSALHGTEQVQRALAVLHVVFATATLRATDATQRAGVWLRSSSAALHLSEAVSYVQTRLVVVFATAALHVTETPQRVAALLRTAANSVHGADTWLRRVSGVRQQANTLSGIAAARRTAALQRGHTEQATVAEGTQRARFIVRMLAELAHVSEATERALFRFVVVFANAALHAGETAKRTVTVLRSVASAMHASAASTRLVTAVRVQGSALQGSSATRRLGTWLRIQGSSATVGEGTRRLRTLGPRVVSAVLHGIEGVATQWQRLFVVFANATATAHEGLVRRVAAVRHAGSSAQLASQPLRQVLSVRVVTRVATLSETVARSRFVVRVVSSVLTALSAARRFLFGTILPVKSPTAIEVLSHTASLTLQSAPAAAELHVRTTTITILPPPTAGGST